ncbi:phage minor head protein [Bacteroides oleiciplenus]|uniref:LPD3 domain-containing protein n=1 Tax=Bacteroides oleiciplenus TaxID=626931 RepID=UPI0026DB96FF|nr:phage minor head protein [Bacteroides oleiciplenus]
MQLDKKEEEEETGTDTTSVEAAFAMLMKWLHRQPEFTPEMLKDEEVQQFVRTHAAVLDDAVDYSIRQRPLDDISVQRLKESNFVFSGFKTFHELNEAFPSLLDDDGNRKPFERFLNDVQKVNENYNKWYLKAEYNFAMASADMAAKWQGWWDDEDRDRYLLQYRTVGDKRVRESHRLMHNITLPITSKFWDSYFPPNGWNCRCTVARVRRDKYPESNEREAMLAGSQATAGKHQEMMRFNPGKQMACFPFYNPYTISKCKNCELQPMKLMKKPDNELCAACKVIREMKKRKEELKIQRAEIKEKAQFLKERKLKNEQFGKDISVSGTNIKEWLNQPHKWISEKNRMLLDIEKVIAKAPYLGSGPDKHDPDITMHLFETTLHEEKSWIIVRELIDGSVKLHSISDSEDILKYLKNKRE